MTTPTPFPNEPEHPLIPLPSPEVCQAIIAKHGLDRGTAILHELLAKRRELIKRAHENPLECAPQPRWWRMVRSAIRGAYRKSGPGDRIKLLVLLGGNRSGKTNHCAFAFVRAALNALPCRDGVDFLVGSQNLESSITVAQRAVWSYLPPRITALNGTRDKHRGYFVNYSPKEGFSERVLVLPDNNARIRFETFNNDPADYEGWEFGCRTRYDVAWWFDEDAPWVWIEMANRRGRYRPGYGQWSFTPVNGITPAIREVSGTGKVLVQRRAKLLPANRVYVEGCKPGHVPLVQNGAIPQCQIVYVHSDLSPFGSGSETYAESVAKVVSGKPDAVVLRTFYGFARDVTGLMAPKFSERVHVVRPAALPEIGTNYHFIDPAGGRMWAQIYVRVAPGNPRRIYIWRDWPDRRTYGDWAVPTTKQINEGSRQGWDGDPGPAQRNLGYGTTRYKQEMLRTETIALKLGPDGHWAHADPLLRRLCDQAMAQAKAIRSGDRWDRSEVDRVRATAPTIQIPIFTRYVDPRAAANPQASEDGGTNLIELFAKEERDPRTGIVTPGIELVPAYTGRRVDDGWQHVTELLDYEESQPVVPCVNEPQLYVSEECEQVLWMFKNYTGRGGESGACKDFADLVRYVAQCEDLVYVAPDNLRGRRGWSY